jgi:hypothetical protein
VAALGDDRRLWLWKHAAGVLALELEDGVTVATGDLKA